MGILFIIDEYYFAPQRDEKSFTLSLSDDIVAILSELFLKCFSPSMKAIHILTLFWNSDNFKKRLHNNGSDLKIVIIN